ncbi:MAG: FAD-dependent monooxygenase, partial [Planctomycetes bacterium]|nr:FAD-dependent monooxygenase [Planctomycetota bacterium]
MIATIMGLDTLARESWDVLVVGAGPAGALAARQLALHGDRVLLVDRKTFPRWKVCGACVNGHALSVLRIVGLSGVVQQLRAVPLRRFSLWNSGRELTLSLPTGVAVSRERFDTELVKAAVTAGACFSPATTATVAGAEGPFRRVRLRGERQTAEVAARLVLVADGLGHPSLAAHAEFRMKRTRQTRIGCGTSLPQAPAGFNAGTIYMGVSRHGYVGMVRLEDGSLNVAA